jgi:hypothetical protein
MWHETVQQKDGTIYRNDERKASFPPDCSSLILSGPHFYVANPFNKTPRQICRSNGHYDLIDLSTLPLDYLPRGNFSPMKDRGEYLNRIPCVPWAGQGVSSREKVTDFFKYVQRRRISTSMERTLISSIAPRHVAHTNSVLSLVFKDNADMAAFSGISHSVVADFYVKTTGLADLYDSTLSRLPLFRNRSILVRTLGLNCLAKSYGELWGELFDEKFRDELWSTPFDDKLGIKDYFKELTPSWTPSCAIRNDYARRLALIEIDVLVAQEIGISLPELLLLYKLQFPVLSKYERDTWYDASGALVFSTRKGSDKISIPRKRSASSEPVFLVSPAVERQEVDGWDELKALQDNAAITEGSIVTVMLIDDTQPGGPVRRERKYVAPFALANREEDYRIAWEFFERKKAAEAKA